MMPFLPFFSYPQATLVIFTFLSLRSVASLLLRDHLIDSLILLSSSARVGMLVSLNRYGLDLQWQNPVLTFLRGLFSLS